MRRFVALAAAVLALTGSVALAGCTRRAGQANHASNTSQQGSAQNSGQSSQNSTTGSGQSGSTGASLDTRTVDTALNSVDGLLGQIDSDLAAVGTTPEDVD